MFTQVKKEIGKIGTDFFNGLRFGLGGFPTPRKKLKRKVRRQLPLKPGGGLVLSRRRDFGLGFGDFSNLR